MKMFRAIASSAPILQFTGLTPCNTFYQIVTKAFRDVTPICSDTIRRSWDAINAKNETCKFILLCIWKVDDNSNFNIQKWLIH